MTRMRRIIEPGMAYFITTNVLHRRKIFYEKENALILINTIYQFRNKGDFHLLGFVVMPDHLHLLVVPINGQNISKVMEKIKSSSSKKLSKRGIKSPIWLKRFYDKGIRSERMLHATLDYIHANPLRKGLVESIEYYPYSSANVGWETDVGLYLS